MDDKKIILQFEDVELCYQTKTGETLALQHMDFKIYEGEFIAIVGPSGCGKTTILSLAAGLLQPTKGNVKLHGAKPECGNENLGYMLQRDELFPWRTVEKNIFLPLEIKKLKDAKYKEHTLSLAKKYGLENFLKRYPSELSGGMRQRVALIRTLSADPSLLLLDEPFSALDAQTRLSVCNDVYTIIKAEKKTAILVTHDISEAISVADRIFVLTARPAKVRTIHCLPFGNLEAIKRRELPAFSTWFEKLWRELNS